MAKLSLSLLPVISCMSGSNFDCYERSNADCRKFVDETSFCNQDTGICSNSNVSCGCSSLRSLSLSCDAFCDLMQSGSKCRYWYPTPMCQGSGKRCGSDVCIMPKTSKTRNLELVSQPVSHIIPLIQVTSQLTSITSTTNTTSSTTTTTTQPRTTISLSSVAAFRTSSTTSLRTTTSSTTSTRLTSTTSTSTTTSMTTTTTTSTSTTMTTSNPYASCVSVGGSDQDIFLWAEWPTLDQTTTAWTAYYRNLASFVTRNCARLLVRKLILRIILPELGAWWSPDNSPLYLALLSQIDPTIELYIYPYVMDSMNQQAWMAFSPSKSNVVEGVFEFTKQWNDFLSSRNTGIRFAGMVVDYEEFSGSKAPTVLAQIRGMDTLKTQYGFLTGVTTGYPPTSVVNLFDSVMDHFYVEFYDYYYSPFIDSTSSSPFLLYLNNPSALARFTLSTVLENTSENTSLYGPKTNVMWSVQSINGTCIYPLSDGTCGANYEFGTGWTAEAVNQYLQEISAQSHNLGSLPQGFFQFSFIPISWFL